MMFLYYTSFVIYKFVNMGVCASPVIPFFFFLLSSFSCCSPLFDSHNKKGGKTYFRSQPLSWFIFWKRVPDGNERSGFLESANCTGLRRAGEREGEGKEKESKNLHTV